MSQLTSAQRYTISVMYKQGFAQKVIAETIKKDKSVISRELKRNLNDSGEYSYTHAQMLVDVRKERLSRERTFTGEVKNRINRYMRKWQWSPEQIVGYCRKKDYAMVSVERIYQYVRQDKEQGGDLYKNCRHQLKHRKRPVGRHIPIKDRVSIDERPATADGTRYGDEKYYADKGGRAAKSHSVAAKLRADGSLGVVETSTSGAKFKDNDQAVFYFTVKAKEDMVAGNYEIKLANMELSYGGTPINPSDRTAKVVITDPSAINGVNAKDAESFVGKIIKDNKIIIMKNGKKHSVSGQGM